MLIVSEGILESCRLIRLLEDCCKTCLVVSVWVELFVLQHVPRLSEFIFWEITSCLSVSFVISLCVVTYVI